MERIKKRFDFVAILLLTGGMPWQCRTDERASPPAFGKMTVIIRSG